MSIRIGNFMVFTFTALLALTLPGIGLTSCDSEYKDVMNNDQERSQEKSEQLIRCINRGDAAGIKSMFSERNRADAANEDLDNKISLLISYFPNGVGEYEISPFVGGSGGFDAWSVEYNEETAHIFMPRMGANTSDADKMLAIEYTHINHSHPNQVGVNRIFYTNNIDGTELEIGRRWDSR